MQLCAVLSCNTSEVAHSLRLSIGTFYFPTDMQRLVTTLVRRVEMHLLMCTELPNSSLTAVQEQSIGCNPNIRRTAVPLC